MPVGTVLGAVSFILATVLGPETKGKEVVSDLILYYAALNFIAA